ncbi:hypothetical protein JBL43_19675 [Aureibaculum sp. A20]|uniref:DUF4136 domain-containing protein n=1 Tax=Aureibaculum flavum TaxID=2795986 RepID=A0ABS0WWY2_9FLAO|nr:hypothetical protein [Aureibaculum flavum]MBJ2176480.1 hypothetical protein [Aureibaculum flavum]
MNSTYNKIIALGILILSFTTCKAQTNESPNPKINSENYYEYYHSSGTTKTTTNWLRRHEAVPIIIDELEKLGFETKQYILFELENEEEIILDVYNRDKNFGVVFNTGHFAFPNKNQRKNRIYNQDKFKISGSLGRRKVYEELPKNIIVLQETWYWYQTQSSPNDKLLNKKTAENILREDIRKQLSELKN